MQTHGNVGMASARAVNTPMSKRSVSPQSIRSRRLVCGQTSGQTSGLKSSVTSGLMSGLMSGLVRGLVRGLLRGVASALKSDQTSCTTSSSRSFLASGLMIGVLALSAGPARAAPERYVIDPEHATVAFLIDHVGFAKVLGRFTEHEGSLLWDAESGTLSALVVNVTTASVATDHEKRDDHVRGRDFLHVKAHPTMTFAMEGSVVVDEEPVELSGTLTLRGETRPITLEVTLNRFDKYPFGHKKDTLGASARGSLMRSDHGMTYAVANGLVGDRVELIIEVEAIRQ